MPIPPIVVRARRGQPLGMPPARFLRRYWQKHPLLVRNAFPGFVPPLSPDELAGLACTEGALARIVRHTARRGRLTPLAAHGNEGRWQVLTGPFDEAIFATLPDHDWTLLVQDVDKWDADTAAVAKPFAFIPRWRTDDVMISYAADGGGVGAHVDQYDVFLVQGLGRRRWAIDTRPGPAVDFRKGVELKLLQRFTPDHEWILEPGDVLYLPPGVPHDGVAIGECMTFSVGFRAPSAAELLLDFATQLAHSLPEARRYADPDLVPAGDAGEIDADALRRVRRMLGSLAMDVDDDHLADWFGGFITRYWVARDPEPRRRAIDAAALAARLPGLRVELDPWSRVAWRRRGREARLYAGGAGFVAPLAWARALAGGARALDGTSLAKLPQRERGLALLARLADAGHLRLRPHRSRGAAKLNESSLQSKGQQPA